MTRLLFNLTCRRLPHRIAIDVAEGKAIALDHDATEFSRLKAVVELGGNSCSCANVITYLACNQRKGWLQLTTPHMRIKPFVDLYTQLRKIINRSGRAHPVIVLSGDQTPGLVGIVSPWFEHINRDLVLRVGDQWLVREQLVQPYEGEWLYDREQPTGS